MAHGGELGFGKDGEGRFRAEAIIFLFVGSQPDRSIRMTELEGLRKGWRSRKSEGRGGDMKSCRAGRMTTMAMKTEEESSIIRQLPWVAGVV